MSFPLITCTATCDDWFQFSSWRNTAGNQKLQVTGYVYNLSKHMTKSTKWHVRPAKTMISLGIRPVWSEYSLSAWKKLGSLSTDLADSEDSDQTGQMPRLIRVFAMRTCHFVGSVMRWLNFFLILPRSSNCSFLPMYWWSCFAKQP